MPKKIKLLFTFLAVSAIVSVFSFFNIFSGIKSAIISTVVESLVVIEDDADQDGLSNSDESYWNTDFQNPDTDGDGFLDGEEIASGHDPAKPGPDDILLDLNPNISQQASDLVIAGLVEGSLKPGNPNYDQSLNDLAGYLIEGAASNLIPKLDLSKLIIITSSKENQEAYAKETRNILQQLVKTAANQTTKIQYNPQNIFLAENSNTDPDDFFIKISEEFKDIYNQTFSISVPENWQTYHTHLLTNLYQLAETNKVIAHRAEDPVSAAVAYNLWGASYSDISNLIQTFADKIIQEDLINNLAE